MVDRPVSVDSASVIGDQNPSTPCSTARRASSCVSMPLIKQLQWGRFSQPVDKFPGHGRILHGDTRHVDPVVHLPSLDRRTQAAFMARQARLQVFREGAQVGFTISARGVVARSGRSPGTLPLRRAARFFRMPSTRWERRVVPHRPAVRRVHILHRGGGGSWKASASFRALWWRAPPRARRPDRKSFSPEVGHVKIGAVVQTCRTGRSAYRPWSASRRRRGRSWT